MVVKVKKGEEVLYQCEACGFKYKDEETAKRCEAWCNEHHSCNLDIVKEAVET